MPQPIALKVLLRERHWQNYAVFCVEYDKAAQRVDPGLVRTYPSRAQLHRWLTGALRGLPYPDHCRVLEEMFPGWTAAQLFHPAPPDLTYGRDQAHGDALTLPGDQATSVVVTAPSIGLRPYIEQAFAREHVRIDFAGFSGETLHGAIQEPLDKIRIGQVKPTSLTLRLLLPDTAQPMALPCRATDLADDAANRERASRLTARHANAILDGVDELVHLGLLGEATAQIRVHRCAPLFKLYLLNGEEAFFGFYPIVSNTVRLNGESHEVYDLMGKDSVVFHRSVHSGDSSDISYIEQAQAWFDAMWTTISYESDE